MRLGARRLLVATFTLTFAATSMIATIDGIAVAARGTEPASSWTPATPLPTARVTTASLGDRGPAVTRAQQALIAAGVPLLGGADGVFGAATQKAVTAFQGARGLTATGSVDEPTGAALGLAVPVFGERGAAVKRLQELLIGVGITPTGGADGIFGTGTAAAVTAYQSASGLAATGAVDDATALALGFTPRPESVGPAATGAGAAQATAGAGTSTGFVALGDRGDGVKRLQQALVKAGFTVRGGGDGVFDAATAASISEYQKALGLQVTGVIDGETAYALGLDLPQLGHSGGRVKRLQQLLIASGISIPGGVDGSFGATTTAAVSAFQTANGLPPTGVLDHVVALELGYMPLPKMASGVRATAQAAAATAPAGTAVSVVISAFPVQGICGYANTWLQVRPGGRTHQGVDIIANEGNDVYAVVDGIISNKLWAYPGNRSGNALWLSTLEGSNTYFFYAHLFDFAPGIEKGTRVKAGQIIGFVGETGNAGTPHVHFEVHPKGGAPVNPNPIIKAVDRCSTRDPLAQPT